MESAAGTQCQGFFKVGGEAQVQTRDPFPSCQGALAGMELHAHRLQARGHRLYALDKVLQRVGHYQQVVYIGLDEASLGVPLRA